MVEQDKGMVGKTLSGKKAEESPEVDYVLDRKFSQILSTSVPKRYGNLAWFLPLFAPPRHAGQRGGMFLS